MTNHYHLLIETERENLSKAMRNVNALYAGYFNRKYKRIGHLWQVRFKSWFVTDKTSPFVKTNQTTFVISSIKRHLKIGYSQQRFLAFHNLPSV